MRLGLALGANLGNRLANLIEARTRILDLPRITEPLLSSQLYATAPVDCPEGSPEFLNVVVEVGYTGTKRPGDLLGLLYSLQEIETSLDRPSREERDPNAPRPIDIDLLYVGQVEMATPELVVPHPRVAQRRFVLRPLADIRPDLIIPGQSKRVIDLLHELSDEQQELRLEAERW